jgi:predicted enzyme related to lactoylglutathione lyase
MTLESDPGGAEPVGSWVALTIDCCDTRTVAAFWGGPQAVHRYDEGSVAVMSDPEGNEFCLVALVAGASLA